jgi:hypothetical protein
LFGKTNSSDTPMFWHSIGIVPTNSVLQGTFCNRECFEYRITGNFCSFGLKRWYLIFADFYFCGLKISAPKKKLRTKYVFTSNDHCNVHQLFIATSLQLLLPVIQTTFFSVPRDRKYEVNSWIDIGINFDIFRMYIFNVEFSYFII